MSVGQKLLDVPFPEMVYKLASAIAESQLKLDMASVDILRVMGDKVNCPISLPLIKVDTSGNVADDNFETSMVGAGFQPTFYQFAETMIEVQMSISITKETAQERKSQGTEREYTYSPASRRLSVKSTPVDATYSSKYNFSQEGSSTIKTRLVPVPPNPFIQRLLEMKSQAMQNEFELKLRAIELAIEKASAKVEEPAK
ncbi:MAG: hypothetical protein LBH28_06630 [Oscillospiraceae bacterium]|jgi:hypothetical protein|nr:hypothetical protein [Oscillospiraceae bacterium]